MDETPGRYYKLDSRRFTFAECWRMSPGPGFLILVLLKILHIPLPARFAVAYPERLLYADEAELDLDGRRHRLRRELESLAANGFELRFLYKHPTINPHGDAVAASFLNEDGTIYAVLLDAVARAKGVTTRRSTLSFTTPLASGELLITTNDRKGLDGPPEFLVERRPARPAQLLARHRTRLIGSTGSGAERIRPEALEALVLGIERSEFEHQRGRGVLVPMRGSQVERLRGVKPDKRRGWVGRLLTGWALWPIALLAITIGWQLILGGAPEAEDWGAEGRITRACRPEPAAARTAELPPSAGAPIADRSTLVAIFEQEPAAAEAGRELASSDPRLATYSMANLLLVGALDGSAPPLEAPAQRLAQAGARVMLDSLDLSSQVDFQLRWRPAEAVAASESVRDYFAAPQYFYLRPPWTPGWTSPEPLTARQVAARRAFRRLDEPLEVSAWSAYRQMFEGLRMLFAGGEDDESGIERYWRRHVAEIEERTRRLAAEDDEVDPETAELYLAWRAAPYEDTRPSDNPFEEDQSGGGSSVWAHGRALGRHLGQLTLATDPETGEVEAADPGYLFSASASFLADPRPDVATIVFVDFADAASGLPALTDYLTAAGAESIEIGVEGQALRFDGLVAAAPPLSDGA